MMMIKLAVILTAVLGLSVGAYFLTRSAGPGGGPARVISTQLRTQESPERALQPPATSAPLNTTRANETEPDALDQIPALLEQANAGKPDAQYRLYELLIGCKTDYAFYFSRSKGLLGKEEAAIQMEALAPVDEYGADVYRMCHRLMEEQPELTATSMEWLQKALEQSYPMAQTARAAELLAAVAVANPSIGKSAPPNAERDARALLVSAIASGDSQVLWMLGELRPVLGGPAEETNKERWAMQLAACARGFNCAPDARWIKRYCKADPSNLCPINANAEEMIRSNTGSDFEMIKLRANEINALIDSGNARQLVPQP